MLVETTFEIILPIWRDQLWPNRTSPIQPASSMVYPSGIDMEIKTKYQPRFFAVIEDGEIVGVNSGHQTGLVHYRSRGIWVDPICKRQGIGRSLIAAVEAAAIGAGCDLLWSAPRQSAMAFYARCGFEQVSEYFDEGMDFGPNCYAAKYISYQTGKDFIHALL